MKAALYALHYIHFMYDYGIIFWSNYIALMHSYMHFPLLLDVEAYTDASPKKTENSSTISAYSDACWSS